eukprot:1155834-Pelagomonas_calceolata.AAC.5
MFFIPHAIKRKLHMQGDRQVDRDATRKGTVLVAGFLPACAGKGREGKGYIAVPACGGSLAEAKRACKQTSPN